MESNFQLHLVHWLGLASLIGSIGFGISGCGDAGDDGFTLARPQSAAPVEFEALQTLSAPTIDGVVGATEWAASSSYDIELVNESGGALVATWRYMSDGEYLYVGVETTTTDAWDSVAVVVIDGNDDAYPSGNLVEPHQDFSVGQAAPSGWPGHTSYVVYTDGGVANHISPPPDLQRASNGSTNVSYEFKIPIANLNSTSDRIALKLAVYQGGLPADEYVYIYPAQTSIAQPPWQNVDEWPDLGL